jgi:hypothetical protein
MSEDIRAVLSEKEISEIIVRYIIEINNDDKKSPLE